MEQEFKTLSLTIFDIMDKGDLNDKKKLLKVLNHETNLIKSQFKIRGV